jgi:hypothetical protein
LCRYHYNAFAFRTPPRPVGREAQATWVGEEPSYDGL